MKIQALLSFVLLCLFFIACETQQTDHGQLGCDTLNFDLQVGVQEDIKTLHASVLFDSIVSDSRCPVDAVCIWGGEVEIALSIFINNYSDTVSLSIKNSDQYRVFEIGDAKYIIKLLDVLPHPGSPIDLIPTAMLWVAKENCLDRCNLLPDPGPCEAAMIRYYYDQEEKKCKEFIYGGCQGTVPFETLEACKACVGNDEN